MKTLRLLAVLACPLAVLASSLRPSPWAAWLAVPIIVSAIAAVLVSLRDKQEQADADRATLSLRQ